MSVTMVIANLLSVVIDGDEYQCQIEEAHVAYPDDSGGTKRYTGCPDGEVTVPDPEAVNVAATIQLKGFHDWSDTGISWALTLAYDTEVPFTLHLDTDKTAAPAQARTYTGTLKVPRIPDDWLSRRPEDLDVTFDCPTITGPTRYTAP